MERRDEKQFLDWNNLKGTVVGPEEKYTHLHARVRGELIMSPCQ